MVFESHIISTLTEQSSLIFNLCNKYAIVTIDTNYKYLIKFNICFCFISFHFIRFQLLCNVANFSRRINGNNPMRQMQTVQCNIAIQLNNTKASIERVCMHRVVKVCVCVRASVWICCVCKV